MMTPLSKESLNVFMSLFRGREDVFAIRWERDDRSGYIPAYDLNWDEYATMHDYSAAQKGFTIWKGFLEHRLV